VLTVLMLRHAQSDAVLGYQHAQQENMHVLGTPNKRPYCYTVLSIVSMCKGTVCPRRGRGGGTCVLPID
jgi:hypothetical protein